jgi:nucleotide-binding universal stress UspA family protein
MNKKTMKILWPISPSDADFETDKRILHFLNRLKTKTEIEIQPVSVVSAAFFATAHYFEPIDTKALVENIKQDCQSYLKSFPGIPLNEPLILENQYNSQSAEVHLFTEFSNNYGADMVIMASNGRKGWARHLLGSFTENFLLKSTVPVVVFGPECQDRPNLSQVLLPVELNDSSQHFVEAFIQSTPFAGVVDQINLFHKISMVDLEDITWAPTLYGLGGEESDDVLKRAKSRTLSFVEALSQKFNGQSGVTVDFEISESLDPVAQVLIDMTKDKKTDLLVMRSDAGPVAARILGSVVRSVVREAGVPVMVFPHKFKA